MVGKLGGLMGRTRREEVEKELASVRKSFSDLPPYKCQDASDAERRLSSLLLRLDPDATRQKSVYKHWYAKDEDICTLETFDSRPAWLDIIGGGRQGYRHFKTMKLFDVDE